MTRREARHLVRRFVERPLLRPLCWFGRHEHSGYRLYGSSGGERFGPVSWCSRCGCELPAELITEGGEA